MISGQKSEYIQGMGEHMIIPAHGGFKKLRSFAVSLAVHDGTVIFCERFIRKTSRTRDQMEQAARSGVQNIVEGSLASGTSKKTELKLTNVARASLGELIQDYQDYLRQRGLQIWDKDSRIVLAMRRRLAGRLPPPQNAPYPDKVSHQAQEFLDEPLLAALTAMRIKPAETCANIMLCLTNQASFLLGRQLKRLEKDFLEKGGITERMYHARSRSRQGGVREPAAPWNPEARALGMSDTSDMSDYSDLSDMSDTSDTSDTSDMSDYSDLSDMSDTSDTSDTSDLSDYSDLSDTSDTSDTSDLSDQSDTSPF